MKIVLGQLLNVCFGFVKLCFAQMLSVWLINVRWCFDQLLSIPYLMISETSVVIDRSETFKTDTQVKLQPF